MKGATLLLLFLPHVADVNAPREMKKIPGDGRKNSIRIATWNIDHGTRFDMVRAELQKMGCDLCLLQEVDWNASRSGLRDIAFDLANQLNLNASYGIEFEELSQEKDGAAYIGQATLTNLPINKTRVLRFKRQSGFWQPRPWLPSSLPFMQRRLGSRITLVTDLEFAGKPLVVYNPHLESRSMGKIQMQQLDELLADLAQNYPAGTNAIIAGDINSKYLPRLFLEKLKKAGFQSALGDKIERTHVIAMALDWIFVRGSLKIENGNVERAAQGSDHYPISAQIEATK